MENQDITLPEHEAASEKRAEKLGEKIKEKCMSKHVNVFPSAGGDGGMGGLGTAAAIAAMGNRNESGNTGIGMLAPLLMGRHDGLGAGGFGAGLVGGVLGGLLFGGGRRGGLFGGGGDCDNGGGGAETRIESDIFGTAVLSKLGSIEAAIPLASAQTENVILQQTNAITNLASQAQLANQMGFERTGDRVQAVGTVLLAAINNTNQNVLETACRTQAAIAASETAILSRIDRQEIDTLRHERDRFERSVEVNALRSQVEVNQTVTTTQSQAQAQQQQQLQFQDLNCRLNRLFDIVNIVHQEARATNNNVIAGNTGAVTTGAQTSTPTNVNA